MFVDDKRYEREAFRVFLGFLVAFSFGASVVLYLGQH